MVTLRALRPHTYANRRLSEGDVYHSEKPMHTTLLVAFGHATLVDGEIENIKKFQSEKPDFMGNKGKIPKKRGRPKKKMGT